MTDTICFRVDANEKIGMGHFARCYTLALEARKRGATVSFLMGKTFQKVINKLETENFLLCQLPNIFSPTPDSIKATTVVIDIFNRISCQNRIELFTYLIKLRQQFNKFIYFDDAGKNALRHDLNHLSAELVISPYVGETGGQNICAGPRYFVLGEEYKGVKDRKIRPKGNRLLITCGGSDPHNISQKIITGLNLVSDLDLQFRVACGIGFSTTSLKEIKQLLSVSPHQGQILKSPKSLYRHMIWSDLAISTNGLTKYELAATGTPALLISTDEIHNQSNQPFMLKNTAIDLGLAKHSRPQNIALRTKDILSNGAYRQQMSDAGQQLVDGLGCDRIFYLLEIPSETSKRI